MYSKEYDKAKKEFKNCMILGPMTLGVSWVLAFKEWAPVMRHEKAIAQSHGAATDNGIL